MVNFLVKNKKKQSEKIIILVPVASDGGIENHTLNLISELKEYSITIATRYLNVETQLYKFIEKSSNVNLHYIGTRKTFRELRAELNLLLKCTFFKHKFLYLTEQSGFTKCLTILFLFKRSKVYLNLVGNPVGFKSEFKLFKGNKNFVYILESELFQEQLLKQVSILKNPIHVLSHIPNIKEIAYKKISVKDGYDFGYIGYIKESKGVFEVVKLFHELIKDFPKSTLTFIGTGPDEAKLKMMCLGISAIKFFKKYNTIQELDHLFSKIDFCVLLSYGEGVPLIAMESLARFTPFISTKVGAIETLTKYSNFMHLVNSPINEEEIDRIKNFIQTIRTPDFKPELSFEFQIDFLQSSLIKKYLNVLDATF